MTMSMNTNTNFEKAQNAMSGTYPSPLDRDQAKIAQAHAMATLALAEATNELVAEQKKANELADTANMIALLNSDCEASRLLFREGDAQIQLIDILAERTGLPKPERDSAF